MKPDHVNKMGADLAVQLMLVMVFGLLERMAPDGDVFREDVRQKLSDVADTCSLPPMAPDVEREVRNGAKQVIAGVLQRARTVN
jgi:hypothetical protein